jgi:hypothetical protein
MALGEYEDAINSTSDTTQSATRRNSGQPSARKSAYLSRFCNLPQLSATGVGGLWLRSAGDRVASATLQERVCAEGQGGKNRGVRTSCRDPFVLWILPTVQEVERVAVHDLR